MRNSLIVITICMAGFIACAKKTIPSTTETAAKPRTEQTVAQKTEPEQPKTEQQEVKPAATNNQDMLLAQGKTVYSTKCGKCHGLKNTTDFTESTWDGILKSMIPRAKLNSDEAMQVTAYVKAFAKK